MGVYRRKGRRNVLVSALIRAGYIRHMRLFRPKWVTPQQIAALAARGTRHACKPFDMALVHAGREHHHRWYVTVVSQEGTNLDPLQCVEPEDCDALARKIVGSIQEDHRRLIRPDGIEHGHFRYGIRIKDLLWVDDGTFPGMGWFVQVEARILEDLA